MIAKFKRTKAADGLPLTVGKMYDVLDVKTSKDMSRLEKIKVKNDLGQEEWYKANKFTLFAEAVAYLRKPTAAGTGQSAAQSATPEGSQIFVGIDMGNGADMAAGFMAQQSVEIGKAILSGIKDGIGLNYGA